MKKILIATILLAALLVSFLGSKKVLAEYGFGGACSSGAQLDTQPNDRDNFPFRFICSARPLDNVNGGFDNLGTTPADGATIMSGSTFSVRGGFTQSSTPRQSPNDSSPNPVLVWITIDGTEPMTSTLTNFVNITAPGGYAGDSSVKCPGWSGASNQPGVVFGYRDLPAPADYSQSFADNGVPNGTQASPVAYNPNTGYGDINCGDNGRMIHWKGLLPSSRNGYGFDVQLPAGKQGRICVRLNISVKFDNPDPDTGGLYGQGWFPVPAASPGEYLPQQQKVAAAHIAKQSSERRCYNVQLPPTPANPSCTVFQRNLQASAVYKFSYFSDRSINTGAGAIAPGTTSTAAASPNNWAGYTGPTDAVDGSFNSGGGFAYSYNYGYIKGPDRIAYIERWQHEDIDADGDLDWRYYRDRVDVLDCYRGPVNPAGVCDITVNGNVPGRPNGVRAGSTFTVAAYITNTGQTDLPTNTPTGAPLGAAVTGGDWGGTTAVMGTGLLRNWRMPVNFTLTAPNDDTARTLTVEPQYIGAFPLGAACSVPINVYQPFDINPVAGSVTLDNAESPTSATFTSSASNSGYTVTATATRVLTRDGVAIRSWSDSRSFGTQSFTDTETPLANPSLGQRYCGTITVSPAAGYARPGDTVVTLGSRASPTSSVCGEVVNLPYMKVYSGDTAAGGGFNNANCVRTASKIKTYLHPIAQQQPSNRSGSGGQLAAFALDTISGFTSASNRTTAPQLPRGLTFSNTDPITSPLTNNPVLGGSLAGNGWCAPDYFNVTQYPNGSAQKTVTSSTADIDIRTLGSPSLQKQTRLDIGGGKVTLMGHGTYDGLPQNDTSPNIALNKRQVLYVDGDVYIRGNIVYATDYSGGVNTIPSFALIVRGDIYIDNDVSQLDGLYVAQPLDNNADGDYTAAGERQGRIYTCATESAPPTPVKSAVTNPNALYTQCGGDASGLSRILQINGATVANRVIMNRTSRSIRDSRYQELAASSNAAEIFNLTPEIYLAPPFFKPSGTLTGGKYDYIATLAPIL